MNQQIGITITLEFSSPKMARMVEMSLRPDNKDFPNGLTMKQYVRGRTLRIIFESSTRIETLLNTVDEVLAIADTSAKTISEV